MLRKFWKVGYDFDDQLFDQAWNIVVERLSPAQEQGLSDSNVNGLAIESKVYGLVCLGVAFGLLNQIWFYFRNGIKQLWKSYWTPVQDLGTLDVYVYYRPEGQHRGY